MNDEVAETSVFDIPCSEFGLLLNIEVVETFEFVKKNICALLI